jgi:hypothetical protein
MDQSCGAIETQCSLACGIGRTYTSMMALKDRDGSISPVPMLSPCFQRTTCDDYTMLFLLECGSSCIAVLRRIKEVSSF